MVPLVLCIHNGFFPFSVWKRCEISNVMGTAKDYISKRTYSLVDLQDSVLTVESVTSSYIHCFAWPLTPYEMFLCSSFPCPL